MVWWLVAFQVVSFLLALAVWLIGARWSDERGTGDHGDPSRGIAHRVPLPRVLRAGHGHRDRLARGDPAGVPGAAVALLWLNRRLYVVLWALTLAPAGPVSPAGCSTI